MTYARAKRKLKMEYIGMFPFVLLGRICGYLFPLKTQHRVFLFFPNADIGGSPRVNADIAHCIKNQHPLIIFSKKASNNQFRDRFHIEGVKVMDLHKYIDNKLFHFVNFFVRGLLATWINRQEKVTVLGGESIFFYKVIPHIRKNIPCVELSHLNTWLPYNIGFIDRINTRIFSTEKLLQQVQQQYKENKLPEDYFKKLHFIDNAIDIPPYKLPAKEELQVFFIGRGSPQKRVHLIAAIAEKIHNKHLPVKFNFVGDVDNIINTNAYPYCKFYGTVKDEELMKKIYEEADILLLTSAFEGLPIVVMQMMAYGKVVVSTAVNGIPDYIHHMENGLLIRSTMEEDIIEEGINYIEQLLSNADLMKTLGQKSRDIAVEKFSKENFCSVYRKLLLT